MKKINFDQVSRAFHSRGAAVITAVLFFVIISTVIAIGLSTPVVREYVNTRDFEKSKGAYYLSEAGQEDAIYRLKKGVNIGTEEVISLGGNTATTTITNVSAARKTIRSISNVNSNTRRVESALTTAIGESFVYGVWVGDGGVFFRNTSRITGNLFSSGPICGNGTYGSECENTKSEHENGSGVNTVTGTVISSGDDGDNGIIKRITNQDGSSMYADTIRNSLISKNAYCNHIYSSSTSTCQTLPPLDPSPLPITAQDVANWETIAAAGGTATCHHEFLQPDTYTINSSVNLGPKKIPCSLYIEGGDDEDHEITVTLQGPVWVEGNIEISKHVNLKVAPAYVGQSIVVIADDHNDHTNSSQIEVKDEFSIFTGAPGGNSWVMLLSENSHASIEWLNPTTAIDLNDGGTGDLLLYSRLGNIRVGGNASVNQVTGYRLTLDDTANITYSTGLQNALFSTGPGGAWNVEGWGDTE